MCQGYGLSEASPVISSNALHAIKFGSSGKLVKHLNLKIIDDNGKELATGQKGEIIIKGDNVMLGYWQNPTATQETIIDGWLHTGDMGYMDNDGYLHVLGRFKSLLISNDGEKFSPEGIEEALVDNSPYIEQVVLHNNQNPYNTALIVPNISALKHKNLDINNEETIKKSINIINQEIKEYLNGGKYEGLFPEYWIPSSFAILPEAFTEENKLLNSTMKKVRNKIVDYFNKELDYPYTKEGKDIYNTNNIESLKNWLK